MTEKQQKQQELTPEELEEQNAEELPDREAMSVINPGIDGVLSIPPVDPAGDSP